MLCRSQRARIPVRAGLCALPSRRRRSGLPRPPLRALSRRHRARDALLAARPEDSWPTGGCVTSPSSGGLSPVASLSCVSTKASSQAARTEVNLRSSRRARHVFAGEECRNLTCPVISGSSCAEARADGPSSGRTARGSRCRRPWSD